MTQPYLGEIRMFAGNFAPRTNAYCSGQIMGITQNSALFSLIGTYYGGNGTTTFGLPDLRGRLPVGMGQGNGLSDYVIGEQTGAESITLDINQMPKHIHMMHVSKTNANQSSPSGNMPSALQDPFTGFWVPSDKTLKTFAMNSNVLGNIGGNQAHENRMPAMAISFIIALAGVFPSRN